MINHEPEGVCDVALKGEKRFAIEDTPESDFSSFKSATDFGVRLEVADRDLEKRTDGVPFVTPERALVFDGYRMDRFHAREEGTLQSERINQTPVRRGQGWDSR